MGTPTLDMCLVPILIALFLSIGFSATAALTGCGECSNAKDARWAKALMKGYWAGMLHTKGYRP